MIIEILANTPKWVFGLFIGLLVLGFQQAKDRSVKKLLILPLPIGMIVYSYYGVSTSFGASLVSIGVCSIALLIVAFLGAKYTPVKGVQFQPESDTFKIEGSWVPIILMMAIFFTKYFVGILSAMQPAVVSSSIFIVVFSAVYGAFSGVFVARTLSIWKKTKLPHVLCNA